MSTKCYCVIVLLIVLTGASSTPVLSPEEPTIPEAVEPVKYYTLKMLKYGIGLSGSNHAFPGITIVATNGVISSRGQTYSNDNGVTWQAPTGISTNGALCLFKNGNDVYVRTANYPGVIYKSTDGGATYSDLGGSFSGLGIGICLDGAGDVWYLETDGDTTDATYTIYEYTGGIWNSRKVQLLIGEKSFYMSKIFYDTPSNAIYFLSITTTGTIYTILRKYDIATATFSVIKSFENIIGTEELSISFQDVPTIINNYCFVSGTLSSSGGCLLRASITDLTTWIRIADEELIITAGTNSRIWGITYGSSTKKVYLSHNNGNNFVPIAYDYYYINGTLDSSTGIYTTIIEISNSDRGAAVFITSSDPPDAEYASKASFFTFQEATWGDWFAGNDVTIGMGSQVGTAKLEVRETRKDDFFDGRVLLLWDNAATPALMFMGKITKKTQVGNLYTVELTELKEELTKKKPVTTFTTQTVEQMGEYLATLTNFVYDGGNISSPADTWSLALKGGTPISQVLDEITKWVAYIWYTKGDLELVIDDGLTASGKTLGTGGETTYGIPEIANDAILIATKVIVKGRVEANGPVIARYPPDTVLDVQTRTGEIIARFLRPSWDYNQCLAFATEVYNSRATWTDIIRIPIPLDDTLRPGTTLECVSIPGVTDGTYLISQVHHIDGVTEVTLNNTMIAFEDLTKDQEYARNALDEEWTPADAAESAGSSTVIEKDSLDNLCAGIQTKRISATQAQKLIYDSTHKVIYWVDSNGSLNIQPEASVGKVIYNQATGTMYFYIKATGGVGSENVWLYLDAEDDSAILFQENGVSKGYIKWDKGDADIIIQSDGDIVLNPTGIVSTTKRFDFTQPHCRLELQANQAIGNAAFTKIPWAAGDVISDSLSMLDAANDHVDIKQAGLYLVTVGIVFADNATGFRIATIVINGATYVAQQRSPAISGTLTMLNLSWVGVLAVNATIECQVYQTSGGNLNVIAAAYSNLTVTRIAAGVSTA